MYFVWKKKCDFIKNNFSGLRGADVKKYLSKVYNLIWTGRKIIRENNNSYEFLDRYIWMLIVYIYVCQAERDSNDCVSELNELCLIISCNDKYKNNEEIIAFLYYAMMIQLSNEERYIIAESLVEKYVEELLGGKNINYWQAFIIYSLVYIKDMLGKEDERSIYLDKAIVFFGKGDIKYHFSELLGKKDTIIGFKLLYQEFVLQYLETKYNKGHISDMVEYVEKENFFTNKNYMVYRNDYRWAIYAFYIRGMKLLNRSIDVGKISIIEKCYSDVIFCRLTSVNMAVEYLLAKAELYSTLSLESNEKAKLYVAFANKLCFHNYNKSETGYMYARTRKNLIRSCIMLNDNENKCKHAKDVMEHMLEQYSNLELCSENTELEKSMSFYDSTINCAYYALSDNSGIDKLLEYSINYKNLIIKLLRLRKKYESVDKREKDRFEIKKISLEKLMSVIPEGSILIDFYSYTKNLQEFDRFSEEAGGTSENIIFLKKEKNKHILKRKYLEDTVWLKERLNKLKKLIELKNSKYKKIAEEIYRNIFEENEEVFENSTYVYVCPDKIWSHIPINIVLEYSDNTIVEKIKYIFSVRCLFEDGQQQNRNMEGCLVGAPNYDAGGIKEIDNQLTNDSFINKSYIQGFVNGGKDRTMLMSGKYVELPFSKYEVNAISEIIKCETYTNNNATKYCLNTQKRFWHFATHGIYPENIHHSWFECGLAFAGINSSGEGRMLNKYGNGRLTAEEISNMDLENTEFVVLSACNSANNILTAQMHEIGLHIAFGVAGVKYVISSLWKIDDLATAIFMKTLYEYLHKSEDIFYSLSMAKKVLKNTRVKDILDNFDDIEIDDLGYLVSIKEWLNSLGSQCKIYNSPYYYDAFVCYQYKSELI